MRKFSIYFFCIIVSLFLISGCRIEPLPETNSTQKVTLKIVPCSYDESRTARPVLDFDSYTYDFSCVNLLEGAGQESLILSDATKVGLSQDISIEIGYYKFFLYAKKYGKRILSGTVSIDLRESGNSTLSFKMYPVSGNTGNLEIRVNFPAVSPVKKVLGAVVQDLFFSPDEVGASEVGIRTIAGAKRVVFSGANLSSSEVNYAHLWFYDEVENLVYTMLESVIVVGGCTSTCERTLTDADWKTYACVISLKKDGEAWTSSGKQVALVDKFTQNAYHLNALTGGQYSGNVAEGNYWVYVDDKTTDIEFDSSTKLCELNYYTVTGTQVYGCKMNPVSGYLEQGDNFAIVQSGKDLVYSVEVLEGYETTGSFAISVNDQPVQNPLPSKEYTIDSVSETKEIKVGGIQAITYTIDYNFGEVSASWAGGYSEPRSFTAEEAKVLPTVADVIGTGKLFDAWVDAENENEIYKTTEGVFHNLSLKATWKDSSYADTTFKHIYANGLSLIIQEETVQGQKITAIYIDLNSDGIINGSDYQLVAQNDIKDFTDYTLHAGTAGGDVINSDFKFTMTGGQIRAVWGLDSRDKKNSNKSVLNISGNAKIGALTGYRKEKDQLGNTFEYASNVEGVMLETITDEIINITGQMSGDYRIYCVTPYAYDENIERKIAYIANSTYASYANFACYTDTEVHDASDRFVKNKLAMKTRYEYGISRTYIRLADPDGIVLPPTTDIQIDVNGDFSLGDKTISSECSVFSISVENGVFYTEERTTFTPDTPEKQQKLGLTPETCQEIEETLTYMVQPTATTYEENLAFRDDQGNEKTYVYMHILSAGNQITPEIASDFLSQIKFRRSTEKKITIKVNLETVPSSDIEAAGVVYFNGSFYNRYDVELENGSSKWDVAYNKAKQKEFNGLHGYLMNSTSLVENNYIYETYGKKGKVMSFIGGARIYPTDGTFDNDVYPAYTAGGWWYWQAGPEAGQCFWKKGQITSDADVINSVAYDDEGNEMFTRWNNSRFGQGAHGGEPNGTGEPIIQYLADGTNNGFWNDQPVSNSNTTYRSMAYFVEFTPYENKWHTEEAKYQSITRKESY